MVPDGLFRTYGAVRSAAVALFLISSVIFQRDLYSRMNRGCYAVFCAGTLMVVAGGLFKASYKLLYAFGICDFPALSDCFMPFQATGFTLTAAVMFLVSMIMILGMGYLSSKDLTKASMNWIGETVNLIGMLTLLAGIIDLHRNVFNV